MEFGKRHGTTIFSPRLLVTGLLRENWCNEFCPYAWLYYTLF